MARFAAGVAFAVAVNFAAGCWLGWRLLNDTQTERAWTHDQEINAIGGW